MIDNSYVLFIMRFTGFLGKILFSLFPFFYLQFCRYFITPS